MTSVLIRHGRKETQRGMPCEDGLRQRLEGGSDKPSHAWSPQELEEQGRVLSRAIGGSRALPTP